MKRFTSVLLFVALICTMFYWFAFVPAREVPHGAASLARFKPGHYPVVVEDFQAMDRTRPTPPNHDFKGSPQRVLKGELWRPMGMQRPGPLLVYSHGFMSFSREGEYLDKFLASHGYTVVAVNYPLTKTFAPGKSQITDVVNQPGDIHFLVDTVLDRAKDPKDVLYRTIDVQRIAVAGVSLGGLTSTLAAYDRRMRDPRIAAAISIAGPAFMFSARFFADSSIGSIPLLMIASDTDPIIPYEKNARPILEEFPGSILVTLKGAAHAGFAEPAATLMRFFSNPDRVGCSTVHEGLKNAAPGVLETLTDPDQGLVVSAIDPPCTGPLPLVVMKAARQQMLTTLAVEAFLDSRFAADAASRDDARRFLLHTFGDENTAEVKVETRSH